MRTQQDYETDPTLAVFESAANARIAAEALRASHIVIDAVSQVPLAPGRYQVADGSFGGVVKGIVRGAELGFPAGAVLGAGVAASFGGGAPELIAGLAGAGALVGTLVGSLEGAAVADPYDDDQAEWIELPDASTAVLLIIETRSDGTTGRARQILRAAGAHAFLDPEVHPFEDELRQAE